MTAVMRAMPASSGPKVIRLGVVRGGRVVEERIIKQRVTVTVGSSETAMFLVSAPAFPASFALFERVGDDYVLNVLEGMKGRLALADGITDLQSLRAQRVKLTGDSRGKVVIGDTTLLFQFVAPPPVQARPQLPLGVKSGLAGKSDWSLTFIAAFSFLVHFGVVGAMYSDWSDPIVGERLDVAGLVELMSRIPPPPVVEVQEQSPSLATLPPKPVAPKAPTEPAKRSDQAAPNSPSASHGPLNNEKSAALAARADAMQIQILVSLEGGPAVEGALRRSNIPGIDLSSAAEKSSGAVRGDSELKTTSGGPTSATNDRGLSALGGPTKADGTVKDAGKQTATAGPTGVAEVGRSTASVAVPNADGTVAGLRGRFRSCYQTGLLSDASMSGKVLISAKIGPNGEVVSSDVATISGLSPSVAQCIAGVVKRATFSAPGGSGSTLQIPVTFVQQAK